ncbi:CobW family GTP-binding protein [Bradyrhizobium sp. 2TAF24]|uniref:CobW family GTP-binding protein n=1 Tax=Bradyrhizobium sp. 2TAF24 TaxID=3233011 RepID=UPI003F8F2AE8
MAAAELIPVTVLTGFLGSGKTTALNHLLRQPALDGTVAIINEFGEVGLDHLLIETSEERFALLDNGCICCTVRGDLVETLKGLLRRRDAGELPRFCRILLETTGLADPAPVLHTLMADPDIAARYRIDGIVVTVDAVNGEATLRGYSEAAKQVAVADRLLVTKTDLAERAKVERLTAQLSCLNPTADVLLVRDGVVDPADILDIGLFDPAARGAEVVAWFARSASARAAGATHHHCHGAGCTDPSHHHHGGAAHGHGGGHHGVQSFSLLIDGPVAWEPFATWLDYVASLKGEDLLRFKGLVNVAEKPGQPVVVHGVQHVFHPPRDLDAWPTDDRTTRLVFIVRDIPRELIERTLCKFAAIEPARLRQPAGARHDSRRQFETI